MLRQYVSGKTRESTFAHCGKHLTGILLPENNVIGISNRSMIMDASLENIKTVFSMPPHIVDEIYFSFFLIPRLIPDYAAHHTLSFINIELICPYPCFSASLLIPSSASSFE